MRLTTKLILHNLQNMYGVSWREFITKLDLCYDCCPDALCEDLRPLFRKLEGPLTGDEESLLWIQDAVQSPYSSIWCSVKALLSVVMSLYDASGLLGTFEMFVLSTKQWKYLLNRVADGSTLLDVGAGDGAVTSRLSPMFSTIVTTEASMFLARRLRQCGYSCAETCDLSSLEQHLSSEVLRSLCTIPEGTCVACERKARGNADVCTSDTQPTHVPSLADPGTLSPDDMSRGEHLVCTCGQVQFDVVTCLNVLDRCKRPRELIKDVFVRVKPGGRAVFAVVLPFCEHVEASGLWAMFDSSAHKPDEDHALRELRRHGSWEEGVCRFVDLFRAAGFELVSFSRTPYLSRGDSFRPIHVLDDAIFVLEKPSVQV
eukprot:Rmarinus@m.30133